MVLRCVCRLQIDKEKLRTYNVFLQIPIPIIKQLSNRSIKGVELLQNQIFEDGKDTNETDVDEVENGVAAVRRRGATFHRQC